MTLSNDHQSLIVLISEWCDEKDDSEMYLIMADNQSDGFSHLPPTIEGYRPDLVWIRSDGIFRYIGEAKTRNDIRSDHTRKQISSFLTALEEQDYGLLVVAVPWGLEGSANSLISSQQRRLGYESRRWQVISNAPKQQSV